MTKTSPNSKKKDTSYIRRKELRRKELRRMGIKKERNGERRRNKCGKRAVESAKRSGNGGGGESWISQCCVLLPQYRLAGIKINYEGEFRCLKRSSPTCNQRKIKKRRPGRRSSLKSLNNRYL
jgi:hypothetical protein